MRRPYNWLLDPVHSMGVARQPFPNRASYAWLVAISMVFATYVSVIPFDFQRVPLDTALAQYEAILRAPRPARIPRANYLANILLFVPLGFGLTGLLLLDRARRAAGLIVAWIPVLAVSVVLSLFVEFLQVFAPDRVPGRTDIEAQTLGCLIGIALWAVAGQSVTNWLRVTSAPGRGDRLARVLAAYGAAWIFVNLAPFDITLDPGEIGRRIRTGLISLVPFDVADRGLARTIWDAVAGFLSALPLGALGLVGWTGRRARRDAGTAFAFGAGIVLLVEAAQIFIRSHAADTGDLLVGCLGVAAGIRAGRRTLLRDRHETQPGAVFSPHAAVALALWCLVLAGYHWMPYDFTLDTDSIRRKLERMSFLPFVGYRSGSDLNALNDMLVKMGVSAPLGLIASFVYRTPGRLPVWLIVVWVGLATAIFGAIEAGQFFLPRRVPGPTDVVTGVASASAGLWLGRWLQQRGPSPKAVQDQP